ncbi:Uncharacterised protein [Mycobacteroides abscessus subsp. abscessus]|nr:Uncharacterised protein [Mycobacteroides abscessus subsp. abscessus]
MQHLVCFIKNKERYLIKLDSPPPEMIKKAARRGHYNLCLSLQLVQLFLDILAPVHGQHIQVRHVFDQLFHFGCDLQGELSCRRDNQCLRASI